MIANDKNSLNSLTSALEHSLQVGHISRMADAFTSIAVTTSFLGVTMGLYHFNQDTYKLSTKKHSSRLIAFLITYLPPLVFVIFYPQGFVLALGYASIFVALLLIILPVFMVWKIRNETKKHTAFKKIVLVIVALAGAGIIALQIESSFNLLIHL